MKKSQICIFFTHFLFASSGSIVENKTKRCAGLHNAKDVITVPEPATSSTAALLVEGVFSGKPQK